jgi:hypothetical protein
MKNIIQILLVIFSFCLTKAQNYLQYTVSISNPTPCTSCCNGSIQITSFGAQSSQCAGGPVAYGLMTPTNTTFPPPTGPNTNWIGLCNGTYTLVVNVFGTSTVGCGFFCLYSVGYINSTSSVYETTSKELDNQKLFPNPVTDNLYLKSNLINSHVKLSLYNALGELIREEDLVFENNEVKLNTKDLQNGIYFLNITTEQNYVVKKRFVVAR